MCGIYGTNLNYSKKEIENKLKEINYRGPDNLCVEKTGDVSFGHLRLSIIDLAHRADQPMHFKHLSICYNGEIYNFKEIKKELENDGFIFETTSDTEVLLMGFYAWGEKVLEKINGMFAFALYDSKAKKIFCARDRLGQKPFYYYWKDGGFEFSSQMQPLIGKDSKISEKAIGMYLDCGYIPSPFSILQDVYKLQPGKFMWIDLEEKTKSIETYWDLKKVETRKISYGAAKKELKNLLKDAVKIRMQSDVPLGVFLSGGVDSALVTALAAEVAQENASPQKIDSFTIGFDDPKYDESKLAEKFSGILKTNHQTALLDPKDVIKLIPKLIEVYDEPFADSSALPSLLLNKEVKKNVTVALSGDGGDESFLGYMNFDLLNKNLKIQKAPASVRNLMARLPLHKITNSRQSTMQGFLKSTPDEFAANIFTGFESLQKNRDRSWLEYYQNYRKTAFQPMQRMADLNLKLWLENDSNVKVDRASMAYSVEVRSPFLDHRVVEYARSLPVGFRYQKGNKKRITKDLLSEYIPREIFDQPKKGFSIPLGKWIKNDLKKDFLEKLNDDFLKSIPNFNAKLFKEQLNDHFKGKIDYSFNIWKLYVLALWMEHYNLK